MTVFGMHELQPPYGGVGAILQCNTSLYAPLRLERKRADGKIFAPETDRVANLA
jgi:hypothetical protein